MHALVWFRSDLRLQDNPALNAALESGLPVIACYVHDESSRKLGGATKWFLDQALRSLQSDLGKLEIPLILMQGEAKKEIPQLCKDLQITQVFWNRRYDPADIAVDREIKAALKGEDLTVESFASFLLFEPWTIENKSGSNFKVFTPFWRSCLAGPAPREPLKRASVQNQQKLGKIESISVDDLKLVPPKAKWPDMLDKHWDVSERGAQKQLKAFCEEGLANYATTRDFPNVSRGTSRVSPYLRFGLLSPHQCWHAANANGGGKSLERFLAELGWREFSYHLLFHYPDLAWKNFNPSFDNFPWAKTHKHLKAWQKGQTGIPIIDAGMRQLWQTGWMHNRVRMIVASFLTKHMGVHWRQGEEWFWDTLVDADPGSNSAGWQWVAGCGADAAPYFRVFNPVLQSKKFDPDGEYIKTFVPELKELDAKRIHAPWEVEPLILAGKKITLGKDYPEPILDLAKGRENALAAYQQIKK